MPYPTRPMVFEEYRPWLPTHRIDVVLNDRIPTTSFTVMTTERYGYTEDQWNNELRADWRLENNGWNFRGRSISYIVTPIMPWYAAVCETPQGNYDVVAVGNSKAEALRQLSRDDDEFYIVQVALETAELFRQGETDSGALGISVSVRRDGRKDVRLRPVVCRRWFHTVSRGTAIEFKPPNSDRFLPATITGRSTGRTLLKIETDPQHHYALRWCELQDRMRIP